MIADPDLVGFLIIAICAFYTPAGINHNRLNHDFEIQIPPDKFRYLMCFFQRVNFLQKNYRVRLCERKELPPFLLGGRESGNVRNGGSGRSFFIKKLPPFPIIRKKGI